MATSWSFTDSLLSDTVDLGLLGLLWLVLLAVSALWVTAPSLSTVFPSLLMAARWSRWFSSYLPSRSSLGLENGPSSAFIWSLLHELRCAGSLVPLHRLCQSVHGCSSGTPRWQTWVSFPAQKTALPPTQGQASDLRVVLLPSNLHIQSANSIGSACGLNQNSTSLPSSVWSLLTRLGRISALASPPTPHSPPHSARGLLLEPKSGHTIASLQTLLLPPSERKTVPAPAPRTALNGLPPPYLPSPLPWPQ